MNLEDLLRSRRSIRSFKKEKPSPEQIERLITHAGLAPSASNKQGWRFLIIENPDHIKNLTKMVEDKIIWIKEKLPEIYLEKFQSYGNYFVRFQEAPVVIIPIYKSLNILSDLLENQVQDKDILEMEEVSGLLSVSLAIENLLLSAQEQGLGCSCMTGPLIAQQPMKEYLKIPKQWKMACLIALGYPAEKPEPSSRKEIKHILQWIK